MALSKIERTVVDASSIGSLGVSTALMGYCLFIDRNINALAVSSTTLALGVSAYAVGHLYDQVGQKLVAWKALRVCDKTVKVSSAKDIENLASRLQSLEHAIDHRIDVIEDSTTKSAQIAMGAWVHAAKSILGKAKLFDIAESPSDKDEEKLSAHWPTTARQLGMRVFGYERMLKSGTVKEVADIIVNTDPSI